MVKTKGSPDLLKRVRAFELSLFKVPYAVIAKELKVSERTIKRWIRSEKTQRQNCNLETVSKEVFQQFDLLLAEAWMNYRAMDTKSSARGRALRVVLAVMKFRAGLYGVGVQSEMHEEIDELKSEAESVRRLAMDKISSERDEGNTSADSDEA